MKQFLFLGIAFGVGLLSSACSRMENGSFNSNKVIAHRGAWKSADYPQNSIASLNEAIRLGCEGSEFDVWMTQDSVLVVNHDADYYGIPIETSTYNDLLKIKHPNGENISTVAEYLEEGIKQNTTKLILEIKPSKVGSAHGLKSAEKSVKLVQSLNAEQWVDYISFGYDICQKVMENDPQANVAYLNGDVEPLQLKADGFFGLDYSLNTIKDKSEWIAEAHDLGLTVNVWTVNKKEDMEWLLDQDIKFITTDEPALLLEVINSRN